MKLRTLVITLLFAAGALSSVAVAKGPPPGKGKNKGAASSSTSSTTTTTSENCKPSVAVILKGDFVSAGAGEFNMDVRQANKHGRKYVGDEVSLKVDDKTKFRRNGRAELEDFEAGDWLNVQARDCKKKRNDQGSGSADEAKLLARRVVGKPAKDDDSGSTTTTTTTTPKP